MSHLLLLGMEIGDRVRIRRGFARNPSDDLDPGAGQRPRLVGVIREKADLCNTKLVQDSRWQAEVPVIGGKSELHGSPRPCRDRCPAARTPVTLPSVQCRGPPDVRRSRDLALRRLWSPARVLADPYSRNATNLEASLVIHWEWMRSSGVSCVRSPSIIASAVSVCRAPLIVTRSNPRSRNTPHLVGKRRGNHPSQHFCVRGMVAIPSGFCSPCNDIADEGSRLRVGLLDGSSECNCSGRQYVVRLAEAGFAARLSIHRKVSL